MPEKNEDSEALNELLRNLTNQTPVEPSSDQRQAAMMLREMHEAFTYAGFTDDQAYGFTLAMFKASFQK